MLHGHNPNAGPILRALDLDPSQIERFRDASFSKDGEAYVIDVFCRTGGGNRDDYPNDMLTSHAHLRDQDDEYDCTYAHFYFRVPETVIAELREQGLALDDVTAPMTFQQKSEAALEALKALAPPKGEKVMRAIVTAIDPSKDIP